MSDPHAPGLCRSWQTHRLAAAAAGAAPSASVAAAVPTGGRALRPTAAVAILATAPEPAKPPPPWPGHSRKEAQPRQLQRKGGLDESGHEGDCDPDGYTPQQGQSLAFASNKPDHLGTEDGAVMSSKLQHRRLVHSLYHARLPSDDSSFCQARWQSHLLFLDLTFMLTLAIFEQCHFKFF